MKKIRRFLVTGGAGFIGSHLCERLLNSGHFVHAFDDLSSGEIGNLPASVLLEIGDIRNRSVIRAAMAQADGCFHLGAIASVARSVEDPALTASVNILGTTEVFAAAAEMSVPVVFASSAAIYGRACKNGEPLSEDVTPEPISPYAAEKLANEHHARALGETHALKSFGLRFFNVYGPRQSPQSSYSGVISIFMEQSRKNQPISILGDGEQTRDFIHVLDVISFLEAAMARTDVAAPVVNVATGTAVTIRHLAAMIARRSGAEIIHAPARGGDIRHSRGATEMASRMLGLEAGIRLESGLDML
ncbi:MAG: hypothetical protein RLZZ187_1373 [Pseudomonadota bacterium]|jgi:UDP-glucose 4-epimerase